MNIQKRVEEYLLKKREGIEDKIPDIAQKISEDSNWAMLSYSIAQAAALYFVNCPDDFCVQFVGTEVVIFGGTNRLRWSPSHGFVPDASYCTDKFLAQCKNLGPLPGSVVDTFWA